MSPHEYAFIGLTAFVGAIAAVFTFAVLRVGAAARDTRSTLRDGGGDSALLTAALHEAVAKVKAQERAMSARAEASERLSGEIISSLTSGLVVVGLDGEVRIINPAGRRLLGVADDATPRALRDLPRQAGPLVDIIQQCLANGQPLLRRTLQLSASHPSTTHLGVTISPLFHKDGEPRGAICLFSDLTAVMELEEQVRLKDSLARVGELTAGIAHEFRNGLATIHGYSRLIDVSSLPASQRPCLEGIRSETDALGQVVTNFLNFAKPTQLTIAPVDLGPLVERAAEEFRAEARGRGGDIHVAGVFRIIEGDEVLLRQTFSNLTRNAVEACAAAGVAPEVHIDGDVDHGQQLCRITISDNGPGIEATARERIFSPFFTTKTNGTGLGLALVQKIIVTHNGRISAGSSPSGGASFQIAFPIGNT
jgi:signal transduction histidine kinase